MKKSILFLSFLALWTACQSSNKLHTSKYHESEILIGKGHRADMEKAQPYNKWFSANYKSYQPDTNLISDLKKMINVYKIVIIMGTWCGDSQTQVPALFKVLDKAGYHKNPVIYFVPRKYHYYKPAKDFKIVRVPTIILYKNNKEQGRIIEYPMKNLEDDLIKIIKTHDYHHELDERIVP